MNFYTPADPNLIGSQAVPFLQTCLGMVAQVAMLAGTSEESIRRHFSVHAPHFDAIVRILNQTFQLHDPALPAAMGTGDLTQTVQTATSEPEPDYCTDHDPANGIYNPYRNEDTCHLIIWRQCERAVLLHSMPIKVPRMTTGQATHDLTTMTDAVLSVSSRTKRSSSEAQVWRN
jgi:hypothetical protein